MAADTGKEGGGDSGICRAKLGGKLVALKCNGLGWVVLTDPLFLPFGRNVTKG